MSRTGPAGGAVGISAAALPCSSGPAGRLFIRGPGPGPGPYRSIGQSVPLRAAPGAAALCPRRAPQRPRPHGGREPAPSSGLHLLSPPPPPRGAIPCVSHPFSLSSFSGHPGQSEPVMTARVAGGGGGGEGDGGGRAGGRGAAQALAALSRAGPSRPGGGRALPGLQPGPGREPSSQQESLAPPASRPPQAHRRATPGADGCRPRTVRVCREPGSRDVCELPLVFQAPGAAGRPSIRSCRPSWQ